MSRRNPKAASDPHVLFTARSDTLKGWEERSQPPQSDHMYQLRTARTLLNGQEGAPVPYTTSLYIGALDP